MTRDDDNPSHDSKRADSGDETDEAFGEDGGVETPKSTLSKRSAVCEDDEETGDDKEENDENAGDIARGRFGRERSAVDGLLGLNLRLSDKFLAVSTNCVSVASSSTAAVSPMDVTPFLRFKNGLPKYNGGTSDISSSGLRNSVD